MAPDQRAGKTAALWLTMAMSGCGDSMVGAYHFPLAGDGRVVDTNGVYTAVPLPPTVDVTIEKSADGYRLELLGCSLAAVRTGGVANITPGQTCALTVAGATHRIVDVDGQIAERSDLRVSVNLQAECVKNAVGTPTCLFRLIAPGPGTP